MSLHGLRVGLGLLQFLPVLCRGGLLTTQRQFSGPVMVNMGRILAAENTFLCSLREKVVEEIRLLGENSSPARGRGRGQALQGPLAPGAGQLRPRSRRQEGSWYEDFRVVMLDYV